MSLAAPTAADETIATRPRLLCVDDEPFVLEGLRDTLRRSFNVSSCLDPREALEMLRWEPAAFAVVIADMRMPRMSGAEFLREARLIAPYSVRMLLTGDADLQTAIRAVNGARLFRFLTKPCEAGELQRASLAALAQHRQELAERSLLEQTLRPTVHTLIDVLAVTEPAAFGRAVRLRSLAAPLARALDLPNAWEVEVAAMLALIGAVALPTAVAEKIYAGHALTDAERELARAVPETTRRLLSKIPRLEGVMEILDRYETAVPEGAEGFVSAAPQGALALRVIADYDELVSGGTPAESALGIMRGAGSMTRGWSPP